MIDLGEAAVVGAAGLIGVALLSLMILMRADSLGHPRPQLWRRLALMWLLFAVALGTGLYLRMRFPAGVLELSFGGAGSGPVAVTADPTRRLLLALGVAVMAGCAGLGWWVISPLQKPPPGETP